MEYKVNLRAENKLIRDFLEYYLKKQGSNHAFQKDNKRYEIKLTNNQFDFFNLNVIGVNIGEDDLENLSSQIERAVIEYANSSN